MLSHPIPSDAQVAEEATKEFNRFNQAAMKRHHLTDADAKRWEPLDVDAAIEYADSHQTKELDTVPVMRPRQPRKKTSESAEDASAEVPASPVATVDLPQPRQLFSPSLVTDIESPLAPSHPNGTSPEDSLANSNASTSLPESLANSESPANSEDSSATQESPADAPTPEPMENVEEVATGPLSGTKRKKPHRRARKKARMAMADKLPQPLVKPRLLEPPTDMERFVFQQTALKDKVSLVNIKQWTEKPNFVIRQQMRFWSELGMGKCTMRVQTAVSANVHTAWLEISRNGEPAEVLALCNPQEQLRWSETLCPKLGKNIILDYFFVPPDNRDCFVAGFAKKPGAELFAYLTTFLVMTPEGRNKVAKHLFSKLVEKGVDFSEPVCIRIEHDTGGKPKEEGRNMVTLFHFVTIPKYRKDKRVGGKRKFCIPEYESEKHQVRAWLMLAPLAIAATKNYLFVDMGELEL